MTTIAEALFTLLTTASGVSQLVGTRVYPTLAPQNVPRPFLVYQRISGERIRSLSGPSGLAHPRYQIDAYAEKYKDAFALSEAVRLALENYRGTVGDLVIQATSLEDDRDFYDEEAKLNRVSADYFIWHAE